jgi:hypothetical protein
VWVPVQAQVLALASGRARAQVLVPAPVPVPVPVLALAAPEPASPAATIAPGTMAAASSRLGFPLIETSAGKRPPAPPRD